jgi:hypothetical protein
MRYPALIGLLAAVACGDDGPVVVRDAGVGDAPSDVPAGPCSPTLQTGCADGEKCAWLIDENAVWSAVCQPAGAAVIGEPCTYGTLAAPQDSCVAGAICTNRHCAAICPLGNTPGTACPGTQFCNDRPSLFQNGNAAAFAGVCEQACEPLADNDFDGDEVTLSKSGTACGAGPNRSCGGFASPGRVPTRFTCTNEIDYPARLVNRSPVTAPFDASSCSQGYLPLLFESTGSSTIVCTALCKPLNCYSGSCGSNDDNRLGQAPHRCNAVDRRGTFDTSPGAEHCQFWWRTEIGGDLFLPSAFTDSLGFCVDHSKYTDAMGAALPACASLPDGFGAAGSLGAADLGCVDSSRLPMLANGKRGVPRSSPLGDVRPLFGPHVR